MSRFAIALALLTSASPAEACHKFSVWNFPWAQKCAVVRVAQREAENTGKFVVPPPKPVTLPPVEPVAPPHERTPDQVRDAAEHDAAVEKYKDYLNAQIKMLHELRGQNE